MFDLILVTYLSYRNGMRAKLKGKSALKWGLATAGSYFAFFVIGFYIVIYNFCKNDINIDQISSTDKNVRTAAIQQLMDSFAKYPIHFITIEVFGIGGYLLIRYILDRAPDKKGPEVHWMDKIGNQ